MTSVRTRWGVIAAVFVALGAVALAAYPYGGTRSMHGVEPLRTFELRGAFIQPGASFTADPLLQSSSTPLVVVTPAARGQVAQGRVIVNGRVVVVRRLSLPGGPGERALVRWSGGRVAVALVRPGARTVAVSAASLDDGRRLGDARVRVPPAGAVAARVGPWAGGADDLFLVTWPRATRLGASDRATGAGPTTRLDVLGGAPAFRRHDLTVTLPLAPGGDAGWEVLVARVSGTVPDLVLVRRSGTAQPEVHVLSGESHFQTFILHVQLDLAHAVARRASFVPALQDGKPVLDVIERGAGRAIVRVFPLGSRPPAA
jgi:hypothetical protein